MVLRKDDFISQAERTRENRIAAGKALELAATEAALALWDSKTHGSPTLWDLRLLTSTPERTDHNVVHSQSR